MPKLLRPPAVDAPMVDHALWWAEFHHSVFPLCSPGWGPHTHLAKEKGQWVDKPCPETQWGKRPVTGVMWGRDATKDADTIRHWFTEQFKGANLGGTPDDGLVWIDIDTPDVTVEFPVTFKQSTSTAFKHHLLYRQPTDPTRQLEQTQPGSQYWPGIDTRVAGKGYVVLSPSVHHSGPRYRVATCIEPTEFPGNLVPNRLKGEGGKGAKIGGVIDGLKTADKEVVGLLNTVATDPDNPDLGNLAFAKIASRLAKMTGGDLPLFRAWLAATNAAITAPLSDMDVTKLEGIWHKTEETRLADISAVVSDGSRGWLYEMGEAGYSTPVGQGDSLDYVPWSNFRVTAKSLVDYGDKQVWVVDFHKADGSVLEDVELPSDILASTASLRRFLVNRGMSLLAPSNDKRGNHGERMLCLLQSQPHERQSVIEKFGWDAELEAFVTPNSLIRADSVTPANNHLSVKDSRLNYGFDDGAVDALREFLTFQDPLAMSLLGSFLMATLLRGHYSWQAPNLAIEAHAGSGKSTYLRMLGQFCGVLREPGGFTFAVARDSYAISSNVFHWFDDVPMDDHAQTLFRQSGTGGAYELKDAATGFRESRIVRLHASTVLSAERITFMEQKAMADRFLMVKLPAGDNRKSVNDPTQSQWYDVDRFFNKTHNKDLTKFAGTLVQEALRHVGLFDQLESLTTSTARPGQMTAIMRCGARVLAAILGDDSHVARVDAWAGTFDFNVSPSIVVNRIIPAVWASQRQPKSRHYGTADLHAVYFDDAVQRFYVAPNKLAALWPEINRRMTDREAELTDCKAIELELENIGIALGSTKSGSGKRWASSDRRQYLTYYMIPEAYTHIILKAATGAATHSDDE